MNGDFFDFGWSITSTFLANRIKLIVRRGPEPPPTRRGGKSNLECDFHEITRMKMLSIGILAHNEKVHIEGTLESLFAQDVFQRFSTELIIVANGCSDETAKLARRSLAAHRPVWSGRGSARVEELVCAGKTNAWNQFVHRFSSPQASILILMDADIKLLNEDTISSMVTVLTKTCDAVVCVDRPVKDIELSSQRSLFQRLLVAATPEMDSKDIPLCGQLYCGLSAELRQIQLPIQLPGEDGFLRALLLTQGFTRPANSGRIVLDHAAAHSFASVATIPELFKHEKWIVSGSIINMLLFERFWRECSVSRSAMAVMKQWQEMDPDWLPTFIRQQVQERGWRLLPRQWWTRRWARLRLHPFGRAVLLLPVALIATLTDTIVFVAAIRDVQAGRALRYWGRI